MPISKNDWIYAGTRSTGKQDRVVTRNRDPLSSGPSLVTQPGVSEFHWGYRGAAPRRLAAAILLDYTGNQKIAEQCDWLFLEHIVAHLPEEFEITGAQLDQWLYQAVAEQLRIAHLRAVEMEAKLVELNDTIITARIILDIVRHDQPAEIDP